MRVSESRVSILDAGALILSGVAFLLFKLGGRLWRAVDDNLTDFGSDDD